MSRVVLDASALLALLHDETGADQVAEVIADSCLCSVNLAEVISHFVYLGMPENEVDAMLKPLPFMVIGADSDLARHAGLLRAKTAKAGLSLGDRFCLALALREGLPAWTADRQWRTISEAVKVSVVVVRNAL